MEIFLQTIINGLMIGGVYSLIGMGLNIIFGVMDIVNFCQGELLMVGMYLTFVLNLIFKLDPYATLPIVAGIMFFIGVAIQSGLITSSIKSGNSSNVIFLTVGIGMLLQNLSQITFNSDYRTVKSVFSNSIAHLGGINISVSKLINFAFLLIVTVILFFLLKYTRVGKEIRATSQNPRGAAVTGINTNRIYAITYGIGSAVTGIAGALLMSFYYAFPTVGNVFGTRGFIVVVIGGLGSVTGAFVGGLVLGLLETVGGLIFGASFKDSIVFVSFILILIIRQMIKMKRGEA